MFEMFRCASDDLRDSDRVFKYDLPLHQEAMRNCDERTFTSSFTDR
jgi:hypothetical protein